MDATSTHLDDLTTMPRAARARNLGVRQIRRAVRAGELPVYSIGGWPRVRLADVDEWIESRRRGGEARPSPETIADFLKRRRAEERA